MGSGFPILSYRELAAIPRRGGAVYVSTHGSHHKWECNGVAYPISAHNEGDDVNPNQIWRMRTAWGIAKASGISDERFLAGDWTAT